MQGTAVPKALTTAPPRTIHQIIADAQAWADKATDVGEDAIAAPVYKAIALLEKAEGRYHRSDCDTWSASQRRSSWSSRTAT